MTGRSLFELTLTAIRNKHTQENARKEERILADLKMLVDKTMNSNEEKDVDGEDAAAPPAEGALAVGQ